MAQERRLDMMGKIPEVGDLIAYNPPRVKGLKIGICTGFAKSGLPHLISPRNNESYNRGEIDFVTYLKLSKWNTPKTGFVIVKREYEI